MASKERRQMLLALAPLLLTLPPTIHTTQLLHQETGIMDGAATIGATAVMALDAVKLRAQRPRPQQGGH